MDLQSGIDVSFFGHGAPVGDTPDMPTGGFLLFNESELNDVVGLLIVGLALFTAMIILGKKQNFTLPLIVRENVNKLKERMTDADDRIRGSGDSNNPRSTGKEIRMVGQGKESLGKDRSGDRGEHPANLPKQQDSP